MGICFYTGKECDSATADGECRIGSQNCGWETWSLTDDQTYYDDDVHDDEDYY